MGNKPPQNGQKYTAKQIQEFRAQNEKMLTQEERVKLTEIENSLLNRAESMMQSSNSAMTDNVFKPVPDPRGSKKKT